MEIVVMKALLLGFVLISQVFIWSQDEHQYYHFDVKGKDTIQEFVFNSNMTYGKWTPDNCWKSRKNTRITGYRKSMDSVELDSALNIFDEIAMPLLGKKVHARTYLYEVRLYNTYDPYYLDSASIAKYKQDQPQCLQIKWKFKCFFMFEDSIWFPFEIYIDHKGKLINPSSIIQTLKGLDSYKLQSPQKIYDKANNDSFLKEYPPRKYYDLCYSEKLHYFYFTTYCPESEKLLERNKHSYKTLNRHIFIDAISGNILWRAKAKHLHKHIGCVISFEIEFPDNTLM